MLNEKNHTGQHTNDNQMANGYNIFVRSITIVHQLHQSGT